MGTTEANKYCQPKWPKSQSNNLDSKVSSSAMGESRECLQWREADRITHHIVQRMQTPPNDALRSSDEGIWVPSFLQPLLGLDFVPYMPKDEVNVPEECTEPTNSLTDQDLKDLDLAVSSSGSVLEDDFLDPSTLTPTSSDHVNVHNEADTPIQPNVTFDPEINDIIQADVSPQKREKRQRKIKAALTKLMKNRRRANSTPNAKKMREEIASPLPPRKTPPRKLSSGDYSVSWHDSFDDDFGLEIPKEKIEFSSADSTTWFKDQRKELQKHIAQLTNVQQQAKNMQTRTNQINKRLNQAQNEMLQLQKALKKAEERMQRELSNFENAKSDLARLENSVIKASEAVVETIRQMQLVSPSVDQPPATPTSGNLTANELLEEDLNATSHSENYIPIESAEPVEPLRPRAATAPSLSTSRLESFMRVHDLDLDSRPEGKDEASTISSSSTSLNNGSANEFVFVDHQVTTILRNLSKLGYSVATDESARFKPTRDTEKLLASYKNTKISNWPVHPWHAAHGSDILVWTGGVSHNGFGSNVPVCKGRALMQISARELLEYLLDSSKIKEYNKISQGRDDILVIQSGVDTKQEDSPYGFAGDCKIIKSLNKPRMLPKTIEMVSLMYAKEIEKAPGSYLMVSRSVFEDDTGKHKTTGNTIRSEMLLGVSLIRPVGYSVCELTTINHVYAPGVPDFLVKKAAPSQAYGMLQDLQNIFQKSPR